MYSSNRGLCAGFNSNLLRFTETWLHKKETSKKQINLHMIGRKGRDFFKARKIDLKNVHLDYAECLTMNQATELAEKAITDFLSGDIDSYYIIYNTQSCGVYTVSRKRIKIYHGGHIR
ncbi:F0F1 ATP synthase subunit gamma [bacterium]|nr:F0F1 ATP synthase subunit gamma [bacterium]